MLASDEGLLTDAEEFAGLAVELLLEALDLPALEPFEGAARRLYTRWERAFWGEYQDPLPTALSGLVVAAYEDDLAYQREREAFLHHVTGSRGPRRLVREVWAARVARLTSLSDSEKVALLARLRGSIAERATSSARVLSRIIKAPREITDEFRERWAQVFQQAVKRGARDAALTSALGLDWQLKDPRALDSLSAYAGYYGDRISKLVPLKAQTRLKLAVISGMDAGEGIPQMRKRVQGVWANLRDFEADRIARTEAVRARIEGRSLFYESFGVEDVVWICDDDPCDICAPRCNQEFTLKFARKAIPVHPNCECDFRPTKKSTDKMRADVFSKYGDDVSAADLDPPEAERRARRRKPPAPKEPGRPIPQPPGGEVAKAGPPGVSSYAVDATGLPILPSLEAIAEHHGAGNAGVVRYYYEVLQEANKVGGGGAQGGGQALLTARELQQRGQSYLGIADLGARREAMLAGGAEDYALAVRADFWRHINIAHQSVEGYSAGMAEAAVEGWKARFVRDLISEQRSRLAVSREILRRGGMSYQKDFRSVVKAVREEVGTALDTARGLTRQEFVRWRFGGHYRYQRNDRLFHDTFGKRLGEKELDRALIAAEQGAALGADLFSPAMPFRFTFNRGNPSAWVPATHRGRAAGIIEEGFGVEEGIQFPLLGTSVSYSHPNVWLHEFAHLQGETSLWPEFSQFNRWAKANIGKEKTLVTNHQWNNWWQVEDGRYHEQWAQALEELGSGNDSLVSGIGKAWAKKTPVEDISLVEVERLAFQPLGRSARKTLAPDCSNYARVNGRVLESVPRKKVGTKLWSMEHGEAKW